MGADWAIRSGLGGLPAQQKATGRCPDGWLLVRSAALDQRGSLERRESTGTPPGSSRERGHRANAVLAVTGARHGRLLPGSVRGGRSVAGHMVTRGPGPSQRRLGRCSADLTPAGCDRGRTPNGRHGGCDDTQAPGGPTRGRPEREWSWTTRAFPVEIPFTIPIEIPTASESAWAIQPRLSSRSAELTPGDGPPNMANRRLGQGLRVTPTAAGISARTDVSVDFPDPSHSADSHFSHRREHCVRGR
ncbi:hypothetical protein LV75_003602 [Actinokineospora diospyrosa]|uniref:Uncharacterized protein n=1 Tax=Actinokineospora diospyrosa TaxID=103728 RepID=A0ABT1IEL1_9PSEU|nr:hypothetical protein [Actinokineospora diospyrosa]